MTGVKIPLELRYIRQGAVFYMKDRRLSSPEPHYFVVLNHDPLTAQTLLLAVSTSKIDKVEKRISRKGFPVETRVVIEETEYQDFTTQTCIDCNTVFSKPLAELVSQYQSKEVRSHCDLPEDKLEEVIAGVLLSPQVTPEEKAMLKKPG